MLYIKKAFTNFVYVYYYKSSQIELSISTLIYDFIN